MKILLMMIATIFPPETVSVTMDFNCTEPIGFPYEEWKKKGNKEITRRL